MTPIVLNPLTKEVVVEYTQNAVDHSSKRKAEIEAFWKEVNRDGTFHRGEVFTVDSIVDEGEFSKIRLNHTDYAHYLHTVRNHIADAESCKVVYGAGLVETKDHYYLFGEMGRHTAYPERLQCVGGGLSSDDRTGHVFDLKKSVLRELSEELGINASDSIEACTPAFIKTGGTYDFIVVLFHIQLRNTLNEVLNHYRQFEEKLRSQGEEPEFEKVISIGTSRDAVLNFLKKEERPCVDYLKPFLEKMVQ